MKRTLHSIAEVLEAVKSGARPIVLFSGGLDGAYLLHCCKQIPNARVLALTIDIGGEDDVNMARETAKLLGVDAIVLDKKNEFAYDFVLPALQAQSQYLGGHPISASLSRPMLAKNAYEVAKQNGCNLIIHTATSSQNSLRRFNGAFAGLGFDGLYGSPYELSAISREEKIAALKNAGFSSFQKRTFSSDSNLWCREFESGELENPENIHVAEGFYKWSKTRPEKEGEPLEIIFENGVPKQINGKGFDFVQLVSELNSIAGAYGLGRYIGLEEIQTGVKFQEIREMPAAHVLLDAYRRIETACLSAECIREKIMVEQIWTREAVEGRWFSPLREAAQGFISSLALKVTGVVKYQLRARELMLTSLVSETPLYIKDRTAYETQIVEELKQKAYAADRNVKPMHVVELQYAKAIKNGEEVDKNSSGANITSIRKKKAA